MLPMLYVLQSFRDYRGSMDPSVADMALQAAGGQQGNLAGAGQVEQQQQEGQGAPAEVRTVPGELMLAPCMLILAPCI